MSILLHGNEKDVSILMQYLIRYNELRSVDPNFDQNLFLDSNYNLLDHTILSIETKYYFADIAIQHHCIDKSNIELSINDFEAIIVIFNSNLPESQIFNESSLDSVTVRIGVLLNDITTDNEEIKQSYVLWCLDHGFEFIEIDQKSLTQGWQERDKDGFPRLIESLECNMWSAMKKKPFNKPNVESNLSFPEEKHDKTTTSTNSSVQNNEVEALCDNFSSIVDEVRIMRERVQEGNLDDETRRNKASEIALKLMEFMNLDEDDEEDVYR